MSRQGCAHDGRTWFPAYEYPLCQACYDDAYLAWWLR